VLGPQPEGGCTVAGPVLPELVTEGDTPEEVMRNVRDALKMAIELYQEQKKPLPADSRQDPPDRSVPVRSPLVAGS
jgi:antitoxin HicB